MLIRPYESNQCLFGKTSNCPIFFIRFLFSLGLPSLTSAFMLLHSVLLEVKKIRLSKFSKLQNWTFLLSLVVVSYILGVTIDIVVFYYATAKYLVSICQGYFIAWSACLVLAYLYTGLGIPFSNQRTLITLNGSQACIRPSLAKTRAKNLRKVTQLTLTIAGLGTVYLACQVYSLTAVYVQNLNQTLDPWHWLSYEYFHRLSECCMASCLLFNVTYKQRKPRKRNDFANVIEIMRLFGKLRTDDTLGDITNASTAIEESVVENKNSVTKADFVS